MVKTMLERIDMDHTPLNQRRFTEQAQLFAHLSELAYKDIKDVEEEFAQLGFVAHFFNNKGSQAYLLKNAHDLIVVCRGTQPTEFADIAADLDARMVPSSTGIGHVHKGFKTSVDNIWPELEEQLKTFGKTRTVWCTGHSLGAAMATLLAYRLQRTEDCPNPQALYTYGSPKVGNNKYVKQIESIGLLHFRFVNNADIVARVPVWPYRHFGGMYYLNHWGNLRGPTAWQVTKDVWRGFVVGLKKKEINFFSNHAIGKYSEHLKRWDSGEEYPQS
jgi:triacylglycerol lipase